MLFRKYSLFAAALIVAAVGCKKSSDFLDAKVPSDLNEETVFSDSARTMNFLNRIYTQVQHSSLPVNYMGVPTDVCTDNGEVSYSGATQPGVYYNNGSFTPASCPFNGMWNDCYANIRRANRYLSKVSGVPLSDALKNRTSGEAKFLRTWYYFLLWRTYGGVPIVPLLAITDELNLPRNSYQDVVNYMVKELDEAATLLPLEHEPADYGRATKGACLALKSRILLYAASPLYNGGGISSLSGFDAAKQFVQADADPNRWVLAKNAALAVINLNRYNLYVDNTQPGYGFYKTFLTRVNNEMIFCFMNTPGRSLEFLYLPKSRAPQSNVAYLYPTQSMVDAFPMANGLAITDPASGYDPANPYVGREPRFKYSILHNGTVWRNNSGTYSAIYTYFMAPNDGMGSDPSGYATRTGAYVRKLLDENVTGSQGSTEHNYPLIRYAEILLNLAEAENEIGGPSEAVFSILRDIRRRAGIQPGTGGNFGIPVTANKDALRDFILNERRIELAFEGHRFWDNRRTKIAEFTDGSPEGKPFYATKITGTEGNWKYELIEQEKRFFRPEMYYVPLPQTQINTETNLVQNPGW
ncbi:RagB/SusD family nutrient uptake outer membrane protein [Chitinophaga sp. NPDC101104]|uniref:RagB/SusD family nutrient uptake outer membrane protein n=1 Tax=Chitinophaga sp. NPDC101104 TaxID=3390561 RepID=UPI003CFDA6C3